MTTLPRFEIHQPAQRREKRREMLAHYGEEAGHLRRRDRTAAGDEAPRAELSAISIDLKVVPGLNAIETRDGTIEIGAACDASQH